MEDMRAACQLACLFCCLFYSLLAMDDSDYETGSSDDGAVVGSASQASASASDDDDDFGFDPGAELVVTSKKVGSWEGLQRATTRTT